MNKWAVFCLLFLAPFPVWGQHFTDGFDGASQDNFTAASPDWEAIWSGDEWTTKTDPKGVAPSTDVDGPGQFGGGADPFENGIVAGDPSWRDYSVEAEFFVGDDDALGVIVRYGSADSFYLLVMSRDAMPGLGGTVETLTGPETRVYRVDSAGATVLGQVDGKGYAADFNTRQRVYVEVVGASIKGWMGAEPLDLSAVPDIDVQDTAGAPLVSGRAGLYAFEMGEQSPGTYFDSFRIRPMDSDGDGKNNDDEIRAQTDPADADSDDDGIQDGDEYDWRGDADLDGLINALDWDSDNDGLPDGLERGYSSSHEDTDLEQGHFAVDEDPKTTTNHLNPDSDGGGVEDGLEDLNHNGRFEPELGETDPNNPSDDGKYPDAGTDADTDTDGDTDGDTDTDVDTENTSDGSSPYDAGWGGLYGGPGCSCSAVLGGPQGIFPILFRVLIHPGAI